VQPGEVEEACAGDMRGFEFGARIALGHRQVQRGIEHREVGRGQLFGQPLGRNEHVHCQRG